MKAKIPLINRIKKQSHRDIAKVQDIIVEELYKVIPESVFHGGTCIWRCYQGNRFSEDLDFYLPKNKAKIELIFKILKEKGFEIRKKKISERSVYSELAYARVSVRLEATFQKKILVLADYEKADGTIIAIYGLPPEELIKEKAVTYLKRRKVRDLYDVFFLLKIIKDIKSVSKEIKKLIDNYSRPEDEENLRTIILQGIVPTAKQLIKYIRRKWENPNI